jgi:TRAP transporter TAXI family solute receptor
MDGKSGVFLTIAVLLVSFAAVGTHATAGPYKLPNPISWATKDVGTGLYQTAATMSQVLAPELGVKIRIIPGNDFENNIMMRMGRAHLACMGQDTYWSGTGLSVYAVRAFGPQHNRIVWPGIASGSGGTLVATNSSGIKTIADLKGKKMATVTGAAHYELIYSGLLSMVGLTLDDVKLVGYPSDGAAMKALTEGKVDAKNQSPLAPGSYEAEASPFGFYVVPIPTDKEAWAKLNKYVPFLFPDPSTEGAGIKAQGGSVMTVKYPWPILVCGADMPDEFAYRMCKAIYAKLDQVIAAWPKLTAMKVENGVKPGVTKMAPFHPGSIKFFKEIGAWTAEHEAANQKKLAEVTAWKNRWDKFLQEATKITEGGKRVKVHDEWTKIMVEEFGFVLPKGF